MLGYRVPVRGARPRTDHALTWLAPVIGLRSAGYGEDEVGDAVALDAGGGVAEQDVLG